MDFDEAMEVEVTREEARREIAKHGEYTSDTTFEAFVAEFGNHETYCGGDVLQWLGY